VSKTSGCDRSNISKSLTTATRAMHTHETSFNRDLTINFIRANQATNQAAQPQPCLKFLECRIMFFLSISNYNCIYKTNPKTGHHS